MESVLLEDFKNESEDPFEGKPEDNSIYHLFFGKLRQILKVTNGEKSKTFNEKTEKMGPIMIDIANYSSLFKAWSSQHSEQIPDFNCQEVAKSFYETPDANLAAGMTPMGQMEGVKIAE